MTTAKAKSKMIAKQCGNDKQYIATTPAVATSRTITKEVTAEPCTKSCTVKVTDLLAYPNEQQINFIRFFEFL